MLNASEILTAVGAGTTVVAASIATTLYFTDVSNRASELDIKEGLRVEGRRGYELGDAFFPCRDHIASAIPFKVRNVNIDSRSSRFDENDNSHVVFIDIEVIERPDSRSEKYSYNAHIVCRVSASNNEVTSFKVRKG